MLERLSISKPPQTGRTGAALDDEGQGGFWSQIQAAFRGLSGAYAAFANDPDPQVRSMGQVALRRNQPQADDYFAIADRCAQLTFDAGALSSAYAVKALTAYERARNLAPHEEALACAAMLRFVLWVGDLAENIGSYDALRVGLLVNERLQQLDLFPANSEDALRLHESDARLSAQLRAIVDQERAEGLGEHIELEREARALRDRGHLLLRLEQPADALIHLERSLKIDDESAVTWLLCATALTDLVRYDDAITAYDRALLLDRDDPTAWNSKGTLLLELGRLEPALECFEKALTLPDIDATTQSLLLLNKGKALYMLKRYDEARNALTCSQALQPSAESAAGIAACRELLKEA
jgi:tetratricopeptide (TPR) repeat protein